MPAPAVGDTTNLLLKKLVTITEVLAAGGGGGGGTWGSITGTLSNQLDLQAALNAKVTSGGDLGTPSAGVLTNCTFPTLNQNTSGTAANLSGTPALPNGTTATTQSAGDNSTKLATTAYADAAGGVTLTNTVTLTNKRVTPRVVTASDATSITPNSDNADVTYQANTQAVGTLTINADAGTPTNGQLWILKLKSTNVQTFSWNAQFVGSADQALPGTSSGASKIDYLAFRYDTVNSKWALVGRNFGF